MPFVDTPLNITVIRFAQLGIPVKSIDVPLVDATAVPLVIPSYTAPEFVVTPAEPFIVTAIVLSYSYIMLIEPAENVAVPESELMRNLSKVPPIVTLPPPIARFAVLTAPLIPATQMFPEMLVIVIIP